MCYLTLYHDTASGQLSEVSAPLAVRQKLPLLAKHRPQLWREMVIDQVLASVTCTPEEVAVACQQFYGQTQVASDTEQQAYLARYHITADQLERLATRSLRLEKFKEATWGHCLAQLPYPLEQTMRQQVLDELFENWLAEKIQSNEF